MTILMLSSPAGAGPCTANWQLKPEGYFGHGLGHRALIRTPDGYRAQPLEEKSSGNSFRQFDLTPSALVAQDGGLSLNASPENDELILLITLRSPYGVYHLNAHNAEVLLKSPMHSSLTCHLAVRLTHPDGSLVARSGNTAEIYSWHGRKAVPIYNLGLHLSDVIEDHRAASQRLIDEELLFLRTFTIAA